MAQRHVVPNHFRSLRTPSPSPTNAGSDCGFWATSPRGGTQKAVGAIPDFSHRPSSSSSPGSSSSTAMGAPEVAAAAEARVARHAKFRAEQREAAAKTQQRPSPPQRQQSQTAATSAKPPAQSPRSPRSPRHGKRPGLLIDTSQRGSSNSRGTSPSAASSSLRSPPSVKSKSGSPLNDGSLRFRPQPHAEAYRAVLAEDHTELYTWLSNRQNFWASRGL